MSEEAAWEGKRICLLLPFYRDVHPLTAFSLLALFDRTKMAAILNYGDAFIINTRNRLASKFLATGIEWAVTVDSDMVLPCGDAKWFNSSMGFGLPDKFSGRHTINRLLSHGKTLVGALYMGRAEDGKPVYAEGYADESESALVKAKGAQELLKPTRWVGTGCLLIHRSVFLDIEKKFPNTARDSKTGVGKWFTPDSDTMTKGEDVLFCMRAQASGHQPYVDLGLRCGHAGNKIF